MRNGHREQFYFALRKDTGRPVHISQIQPFENGVACNCICASCGKTLVAKLGHGKRVPHFAHYTEQSVVCSVKAANESALHKLAKQILCESNSVVLPALIISEDKDPQYNQRDPKQCVPYQFGEPIRFLYDEIYSEMVFDGFTPDICVYKKKKPVLFIEIAVTHFIDKEKYIRLKDFGISTLEVDVSCFLDDIELFSFDGFRNELLKSLRHKTWIYNRFENEGIRQLCKRNRKLEEEYLAKQERQLQDKQRREQWRAKMIQHEQQAIEETTHAETDVRYYLECCRKITNDADALYRINHLGNCHLRFSSVMDIPFFLNIPVFGEIAFNCDRRIWQALVFEHFIYRRRVQDNPTVSAFSIYRFFACHETSYANPKFVHRQTSVDYFPEDKDILRRAIEEYMVHLSGLGFIDLNYYWEANPSVRYAITANTLIPPNKRYASFLKNAIGIYSPTNNPFQYFQDEWEKECVRSGNSDF